MNLETIIESIALKVRYSITRMSGGGQPTKYALAIYGNQALTLREDGKLEFPSGISYYVEDDVELTQIIEQVASQFS